MIVITIISVAAGCASRWMFASIISGALDHCYCFSGAVAADGGGPGWGPIAPPSAHRRASGLGAMFGLPLLHPCGSPLRAPPVARSSRAARPAISNAGSGNGAAPPPRLAEWYPVGRILLWIAGFAILTNDRRLLTLGADARPYGVPATRAVANPRTARCGNLGKLSDGSMRSQSSRQRQPRSSP